MQQYPSTLLTTFLLLLLLPLTLVTATPITTPDSVSPPSRLRARDQEVWLILWDKSRFRGDSMYGTVHFSPDSCYFHPLVTHRTSSLSVGNGCCNFYNTETCEGPLFYVCDGDKASLGKYNDKIGSWKCFES